jgi:mono/diheme cytochrome c family protein
MTTSRFSATLLRLLVVIPAAALLAVGCGGDSDADSGGGDSGSSAGGKSLFVTTCGGCHTLSDAGTNGAVGPSLDGRGADAALVMSMIENGGGGMPAGLLEGKEADAVAEYVAGASGG